MKNSYTKLEYVLNCLSQSLEGTFLDLQLKQSYNDILPEGTSSLKNYLNSILDAFEKVGLEISNLRESLEDIDE